MCVCANFQVKQTALTFSAQICPKMGLGLAIQKNMVGKRISILDIPCVPILVKMNCKFFDPICPEKGLGLETEKSIVGTKIKIVKTLCVPIISQTGQL